MAGPWPAHFRRVAASPNGPFYKDGEQNGGAILDLHIHDTDFIHHLFGKPRSVFQLRLFQKSPASSTTLSRNIATTIIPLVVAEGGWGHGRRLPIPHAVHGEFRAGDGAACLTLPPKTPDAL